MIVDALVLAGGRARRLGGASKPALTVDGATLLDRAIAAARGVAREIVVVGDESLPVPGTVRLTRESPAFGGPVAAIAAGLDALSAVPGADAVLVLACDMPHAADAVAALAAELPPGADGRIGIDAAAAHQPLLAVYRRAALLAAARTISSREGAAMRELLAPLRLIEHPVGEASADIDDWHDAARFGLTGPATKVMTA